MAIPDYQTIMLPLLRFAGDGRIHTFREAVYALAEEFSLSEAERTELLPSGQQPIFDNRVGWASTYLKKAGLLDAPQRGSIQITERGKEILSKNPQRIDVQFLDQFDEFVEFRKLRRDKEQDDRNKQLRLETPEELLETAHQSLRDDLSANILSTIKNCSPEFFERLVVDMLVSMGYGGSRKEAGQAIGKTGDGGIDGIIKEDKLGLDIIYIQAKRWEANVGRPEIQKFAGALQGQRARKGIFITTSTFSKDALQYASNIENKIILIDGHRLAELMIDHNVGVTPITKYEVKRLDTDYFTED
ncbi:restriction endonuclease [candidate division KSB1 bacterium]|nr:restriction endonuclease [candidate division KSB1 bacterium]NIR69417.1 restriction endonuclease [candidate division KSB1 bacterium]NIS24215.1 restriction endonuclease [candidate division KSB1 bacterium]NIT71129.1 restriction endonuclease [candidate division KSB1 bacterium]NIU24834.1 restriction endonuclease [candidate division KSB1 bacterium]